MNHSCTCIRSQKGNRAFNFLYLGFFKLAARLFYLRGVPFWAEEGPPSVGTMARFFARNLGQLGTLLEEAGNSGETEEFAEAIASYAEPDVFWSTALAIYASVQSPLPGTGAIMLPHR
jgi:hypothetical protein